MRKGIHFVSIGVLVVFICKVCSILMTDFDRLTEYGFGYLIGQIILLVFFAMIVFFSRKKEATKD